MRPSTGCAALVGGGGSPESHATQSPYGAIGWPLLMCVGLGPVWDRGDTVGHASEPVVGGFYRRLHEFSPALLRPPSGRVLAAVAAQYGRAGVGSRLHAQLLLASSLEKPPVTKFGGSAAAGVPGRPRSSGGGRAAGVRLVVHRCINNTSGDYLIFQLYT